MWLGMDGTTFLNLGIDETKCLQVAGYGRDTFLPMARDGLDTIGLGMG
jgi:hypothetical protein